VKNFVKFAEKKQLKEVENGASIHTEEMGL